ncbi:MAG TPA: carboxypeptidase-like regulatory domain-containing protein [Candidatus Angelobacter sp.]
MRHLPTLRRATLLLTFGLALSLTLIAQESKRPYSSAAQPRHSPEQGAGPAALLGKSMNTEGRLLVGVRVVLTAEADDPIETRSGADGIFRVPEVPPGEYTIVFELSGFQTLTHRNVLFNAGEALMIAVNLHASASGSAASTRLAQPPAAATPDNREKDQADFRELTRRPVQDMREFFSPEIFPDSKLMSQDPDRWDTTMPEWRRYSRDGEFPYTSSHWWDPFHQNRIKGDKPIFGQGTFFRFTGTSTTGFDVRRLFVPSGISAQNPGSSQFFGQGGQTALQETIRLSFDLFHGDTSFKPVDWQIRITPAFNVNQLWASERGIVNIDVREGTARTDGYIGLQEAFVEKKIADLGPNYDFISVRAGIQQFNSDFRGLLFTQEQPGLRIFGNLRSNRLQYNAAYFFFLEKNTNSGLNTFNSRHQQVWLANFYMQDFLTKGYTAQFSYHYNKDDASVHFDDNGFLVRPAPIGSVLPHNVRAHYLGWTGNGHIKWINISHAIYEVLGHDDLNPFAGRRTDINAQMAALELSVDRNWYRVRVSGLFASGDANPRDGVARGFDAISEAQNFAGGIFSFFNREGIRLTGTGVALVAPDSFLPNLRSSKDEGQANFVNPGLFLYNAGADFKITPKITAVANVNYMRFDHTEPLEFLLFQPHIDPSIGFDYNLGLVYRPPLSENMVITGGVAALTPGTGLREIFTSKTLLSTFTTVRFQF